MGFWFGILGSIRWLSGSELEIMSRTEWIGEYGVRKVIWELVKVGFGRRREGCSRWNGLSDSFWEPSETPCATEQFWRYEEIMRYRYFRFYVDQ